MSNLEEAIHKQQFSQKLLSWSKWLFGAYFVGVSVFFIISFLNLSNQLNSTLEQIKVDNATQHQRTQDYTKCIAKTLLLPLAQRKDVDFDNCAITADKTSQVTPPAQDQQNSVANGQAPAVQAPQIIIRDSTKDGETNGNSSPPTTSGSPPDPDNPTETSVNPADNSRVLTILDGILNDVDNSPLGGTLNKLGL